MICCLMMNIVRSSEKYDSKYDSVCHILKRGDSGRTFLFLQVLWTPSTRGFVLLPNGHVGRRALKLDFFDPIITLFNLNEKAIKGFFLKLNMSCVRCGI